MPTTRDLVDPRRAVQDQTPEPYPTIKGCARHHKGTAKSIEQIKANTRERVAKHRAKNATLSVTVTEKPASVTVTERSGSTGDAEDATIPTGPTLDPEKPTSTANPKDEALFGFSRAVVDLNRRTKGTKPERFAATSVSPDDLAGLGKYLSDLSDLISSRRSKIARPKVSALLDAANDMGGLT